MAEGAVRLLLDKVKEVVEERRKDLISGAEDEFERLSVELGLLREFLEDAAKKTKERIYRERERQVRDVLYEVEEAIDACLTYRTKAKPTNNRRQVVVSSSSESNFSLPEELKSIREGKVLPLIHDLKLNFESLKITDGSGAFQDLPTNPRKDITIRQTKVVGHEHEEKTISSYLIEKTAHLDVISIVGGPGQGKTTFAWKVYENPTICYNFPIRIWVCVSQQLNTRDVFLQILRKFSDRRDTCNLKDDDLAQTLKACLVDKRLLLVLDDVWSIDDWNKIMEVLPLENGNCKVLITSREMDVRKHYPEYRRAHLLEVLTPKESWELLQYEVFGNLEDCPPELREIGERIANKCGGVPLTIVVIGGILMDQLRTSQSTSNAKDEWEMVSENVSDAIRNDKAHRITNIVSLSYDRLPGELRDCFLYLGVFPEDYEFPVQMLFELWIAEGFVLPKNGRSLEETAEQNLNDLIQRNLLKVEKRNHTGKVKTCRVHDMIRAFCITKSEEEELFKEIRYSKMGGLEHSVSEVQKFSRLCFHSDLSMFLSGKPNGPQVRSFLCFYEQPLELEPRYTSAIPDGFSKLRILESKSVKFHQFPAKVTKLIHLRYLTLFIDNLAVLPESISELWNLQTLTVETSCNSITVKANMSKMIRLRHLRTNVVIVIESKWEGRAGKNLQTLNRLSPESCTEAVSMRANNLKTLGIYGKLTTLLESKFLEELQNLENLKLVNTLVYGAKSEDLLHRLPDWNHFPPKLKRLTLRNTFLGWKHMSTLAMIKSLEVLKLKDNAFVGDSWDATDYIFPALQLLLIINTELVLWEASINTFPSLRYLVVENCESLKEIPECVGTNLEKLEIERVPHSAVLSAKNIEEANKGKTKGKSAVEFNLNVGPSCQTK